MTVSSAILDQLMTDLATVPGVQTVWSEPRDVRSVELPALFLIPGEGGAEEDGEQGFQSELVTQLFNIQVVVGADDPHRNLLEIGDEVRAALHNGGLLAVQTANYRVSRVVIQEWTPALTFGDLHNQTGFQVIELAVTYRQRRGTV